MDIKNGVVDIVISPRKDDAADGIFIHIIKVGIRKGNAGSLCQQ